MRSKLVTILFLLSLPLGVLAQQFDFINYSINEGLSHSQVRSIFQDDQGFLWVGTLGGVSRFDGRSFENFSEEDGLLGNQVNHIYQLKSGELVFGMIGGISIFNGIDWKSYPFKEPFQSGQVNDILESDNGAVWIALERGLAHFKNGEITYYSREDGLSDENVKSIVRSKSGDLIIATKTGVDVLQDGKINSHPFLDKSLIVMDMTIDKQGKIWLATNHSGLVELTANGSKEHPINDELVSNRLTGIDIDKEGRFWVRSKNGISRINKENVLNFTDANGLPISDIRAFFQDFEGNIWLGSDGGGLMKYTGDAFSAYTTAEGLGSNLVMSIVRDREENLWFSSFDQGVTRLTPDGKATSFTRSDGLPNNTVWTSATTGDGTVWFGTSNGLSAFSNGELENYTTKDGLSHDKVIFIYPDNDSTLICGTNNGYTVIQNGEFEPRDGSTGFVNTKVRSAIRTSDSTLWLGTLNGVYAYNGTDYINFNEESGLPDNTVYALSEDLNNRVWIGTADGLVVDDENGKLQNIELDDHYRSNTINFLIRDKNESMWIGTNNGIYQINTVDFEPDSSLQYRHYTLDDGIRSLETNLNAAYRDNDDKLWFGTAAGVLHCDLSELDELTNKIPPKVHITEVRLNLEPTDWTKFSDTLNPATGLPVDLEVDFKNNHFSFGYTGISNSDPQHVRYQYQMLGFDENWQPLTELDFATYTNLPYDNFEFQVRALSKNGIWSEPKTFSFSITPPFWLTWWFISLSVIAFLLTFYGIYRYRRQNLITSLEKEKYEFQSKMLTLEQQSLNSSMNRHFIFNALNSIQYYINRKDRLSANIYLSNFAKLIRKNLDSSQSNFTSLQEEIERLELYLNLEHMRFKDKFEYSINIDTDVDTESIEVPAMLLQPFLENSIWHGILPKKELGEIKVNISKTDKGEILFSIQDNGIGIETSRKEKLHTNGNHISKGMSITTGRIDLIRKMTRQNIKLEGPYEILKDDDSVAGTEVKIYLPVDIQNFYPH